MTKEPSVLVVDDNDDMSHILSIVLKRAGCAVTVANDGFEAVEQVKDRSFDNILMDVTMPRMDGVEAHANIKEIRPDAVVMMMTAYTTEDMVEEALREGAVGVMYKPLDMEKVVAFVCDCG